MANPSTCTLTLRFYQRRNTREEDRSAQPFFLAVALGRISRLSQIDHEYRHGPCSYLAIAIANGAVEMLVADTNSRSREGDLLERNFRSAPPSKRVAVNQQMALAQIITLMLRSPSYRHTRLSDLEWMVLPPLNLGQVAVADTDVDRTGTRQPVAVMLWAAVSAEVDERLSSNLSAPIQLAPGDWRSGDILWITDILGDTRAGHALVRNVLNTTLAGRTVRLRSLNSEGRPILLEVSASSVSVIETPAPEACGSSGPCATGTLCASCVTTGCKGHCRRPKP
jgi:hemolysin-activating ACP:hemolysin acyltransferase